jgi:hypothetical protein
MVCARASSNVIWQNSDLQRAGIIAPRQLLELLVEPRNLAFDRRQRL